MSFQQPGMPPHEERETAPRPDALPPYPFVPTLNHAAPQSNPAATASLVLGILSLVPAWFSALVSAFLVRSHAPTAQISFVSLGVSILSALIAVAAIICGHIGWSGSRSFAPRPGGIIAVNGLTLGYSRLGSVLIGIIVPILTALAPF